MTAVAPFAVVAVWVALFVVIAICLTIVIVKTDPRRLEADVERERIYQDAETERLKIQSGRTGGGGHLPDPSEGIPEIRRTGAGR